jgi:hypothetical protein
MAISAHTAHILLMLQRALDRGLDETGTPDDEKIARSLCSATEFLAVLIAAAGSENPEILKQLKRFTILRLIQGVEEHAAEMNAEFDPDAPNT